MKRTHAMPFGADYRGAETRFTLWAPGAAEVAVELDGAGRHAMQRREGGWHEATVAGVRPGQPYAFRVNADLAVPDPASRSNPAQLAGPSVVVDARAFEWDDDGWRGRPWREAVVYELHVGTFTPEGTYLAAIDKLDYLVDLGVTAVELMPLAEFAGRRNWGYDGVLPFAPTAAYGTPEALKQLVAAAHRRGLMMLIDVVYNHFGPEGNYLHAYAPQFFNEAHQTPWGAAINFDGEQSRPVRDFFVHNALYWIEEYRFDGLRMDAVHAIADDSQKHIVTEIAEAIAAGPARERLVHLVLENDDNQARFLERGAPGATAQWNDDSHHAFHVLLSGETDGYYRDYATEPARHLGRTLTEGFAYQGEASAHREGKPRGEPSAHLPPEAFVNFMQNHDQVGNRAMGERLSMLAEAAPLRLAAAALCLSPSIPMLFMGEEFGARTPFLFFCDFEGELAAAVRDGRRREFAAFERFADPEARSRIPDPLAEETFLASKLRWSDLDAAEHAGWLHHYRTLLALRASRIVPRLGDRPASGRLRTAGARGLACEWRLADGGRLHLRANFGPDPAPLAQGPGELLHVEGEAPRGDSLAGWSGVWTMENA